VRSCRYDVRRNKKSRDEARFNSSSISAGGPTLVDRRWRDLFMARS
jgi:c-di-GMP-binding flagellar brake protein YcgR